MEGFFFEEVFVETTYSRGFLYLDFGSLGFSKGFARWVLFVFLEFCYGLDWIYHLSWSRRFWNPWFNIHEVLDVESQNYSLGVLLSWVLMGLEL